MQLLTGLNNLKSAISELEKVSEEVIKGELKKIRTDEETERLLTLFRKSLHTAKHDLENLSDNLKPYLMEYMWDKSV